jgi:hypothetical protein
MNRPQLTEDSRAFVDGLPDWAQPLAVFELARQGMIACAEALEFDDFPLRPAPVDLFRHRIESDVSENADWARIFIHLWFCGNFTRLYWVPLIRRDPGNIVYAIDACYFVYAVSGVDGASELKELIREFDCYDKAKAHFGGLGLRECWQQEWVERVLDL